MDPNWKLWLLWPLRLQAQVPPIDAAFMFAELGTEGQKDKDAAFMFAFFFVVFLTDFMFAELGTEGQKDKDAAKSAKDAR